LIPHPLLFSELLFVLSLKGIFLSLELVQIFIIFMSALIGLTHCTFFLMLYLQELKEIIRELKSLTHIL
jgi:hypothetical protein